MNHIYPFDDFHISAPGACDVALGPWGTSGLARAWLGGAWPVETGGEPWDLGDFQWFPGETHGKIWEKHGTCGKIMGKSWEKSSITGGWLAISV